MLKKKIQAVVADIHCLWGIWRQNVSGEMDGEVFGIADMVDFSG